MAGTLDEQIASHVEGVRFDLQELAWSLGVSPSGRLAELLDDERELTLRDVAEVCVQLRATLTVLFPAPARSKERASEDLPSEAGFCGV